MRFDPTPNDPDRFAGIRRDYGPLTSSGSPDHSEFATRWPRWVRPDYGTS
jgi:hypothetical protein